VPECFLANQTETEELGCMQSAFALSSVGIAVLVAVIFAFGEEMSAATTKDSAREHVRVGGRSALLIGATGATGQFVLQELLERDEWTKVVVVHRSHVDAEHEKLQVVVVPDMAADGALPEEMLRVDHFFNCIGTTRAAAGGAEGFKRIEVGITSNVARAARNAGVKSASVISAQNAAPNRKNMPSWFHPLYYGQTIGQKENAMCDAGFLRLTIFRPGMLERPGSTRTMEKMIGGLLPSLHVKKLAKAMVDDAESTQVKEHEQPKILSGNSVISNLATRD